MAEETSHGEALRGEALREDGTLKDASEMDWVHSPSQEYNGTKFRWQDPESHHHSIGDKRKGKQREDKSGSEDTEAPKAKVSIVLSGRP